MTEREHLVRSIKDGLRKIEEHEKKAEEHYNLASEHEEQCEEREVEVGKALRTLKAQMPKGIKWEQYLEECGIELHRSRADQLIRIADGRTSVEQERADQAERTAKSRAGLPLPPPCNGEGNGADPQASAEAMKAAFAEADQPKVISISVLPSAIPEDSTVRMQVTNAVPDPAASAMPPTTRLASKEENPEAQKEAGNLERAWLRASPLARCLFIRARWYEVEAVRKAAEDAAEAHKDRWIDGEGRWQ